MQTDKRKEYERICNEIQLKFKHKMLLLRMDMEKKRKAEIAKIEAKKDMAIKDLTAQHAGKYTAIKEYYQEITNTNLDIIKQLKDDLAEKRKEDQNEQKNKV